VRPELRPIAGSEAREDGEVRCHYALGDPDRAVLIQRDGPQPVEALP
jgi:hypothetical protein